MNFKSLQDTYLYNQMNSSSGLTKNIMSALEKGTVVEPEQAEEQLFYIQRAYKNPLKYKVLEALNNKDIVMIYSPERTMVPTCVPYVLVTNNGVQAFVFVDSYGVLDKDTNNLKIDTGKLYTLLESALMAINIYRKQESVVVKSNVLASGSRIFAEMIAKVLNKKYSLTTDVTKFHKVLVLASKYYFLNILGRDDSEMLMNYSMKNCKNGNPLVLQETYKKLSKDDCKDISTFINAISDNKMGLNLKGLNIKNFLEAFINMYDASTILLLENFYYFNHMLLAVENSVYMNNQYTLDSIIDKDGAKIYSDIASLIK